MAIYHLRIQTTARQSGRSALEKAQYNQREGKYARSPDQCLHKESGHMPSWAVEQPTLYWEGAQLYERKNGRLFKELEFALPNELEFEEQRELAHEFAHRITDEERLPYTLAIHAGYGHNPHVHLLISERCNDGRERPREQWFKRWNAREPERGGARKTRALKPQSWFDDVRKLWADLVNQRLELAGFSERVDYRSLADQGIDRVPGVHLGPNVIRMQTRGISTDREARARAAGARNAEIVDLRLRRAEMAWTEARVRAEVATARLEEVESRATADAPLPRGLAEGASAVGDRSGRGTGAETAVSERVEPKGRELSNERGAENRTDRGRESDVGGSTTRAAPEHGVRDVRPRQLVPIGVEPELLLPQDARGDLRQAEVAERTAGVRSEVQRVVAGGDGRGDSLPPWIIEGRLRLLAGVPVLGIDLRSIDTRGHPAEEAESGAVADRTALSGADAVELKGRETVQRPDGAARRVVEELPPGAVYGLAPTLEDLRERGGAGPLSSEGREESPLGGGSDLGRIESAGVAHSTRAGVGSIGSVPPWIQERRLQPLSAVPVLRIGADPIEASALAEPPIQAVDPVDGLIVSSPGEFPEPTRHATAGSPPAWMRGGRLRSLDEISLIRLELGRAALGSNATEAAQPGAELERVAEVVERQLRAIGGERFEVRVELGGGEAESWQWSRSELLERLAWLQERNAAGGEVWVRAVAEPSVDGSVVVRGLSETSLGGMSARGYEPAAVVEGRPGEYEAWVRAAGADAAEGEAIGARLSAELGAEGSGAFGRLAGFRVPAGAGDRVGGAWAQLREWSGRLASAGAELVEWARGTIAARAAAAGPGLRESSERGAEAGTWVGRGLGRLRDAWLRGRRGQSEQSEAERPSAAMPGAADARGDGAQERTREVVARQLAALGASRFEVGILERSSGERHEHEWTPEEVLAAVPQLVELNERGHDVYVRPASSERDATVLVEDVDREALNVLVNRGWAPAAVVETSRSNYQAWVRVGELSEAERSAVSVYLAQELGGARLPEGERPYGRLAGLTNRKPVHEREGAYPAVELREHSGERVRRGTELRAAAVRSLGEVPATAAPLAAREDVRGAFARASERARTAAAARDGIADPNRIDVEAAQALAIRGYARAEIEAAMRAESPRLEERTGGYGAEYAYVQVDWALRSPRVAVGQAQEAERRRRLERIERTGGDSFSAVLPLYRTYARQALELGVDVRGADRAAAEALAVRHSLPAGQICEAIRGGSPAVARMDAQQAQAYAEQVARAAERMRDQREQSRPGRDRGRDSEWER